MTPLDLITWTGAAALALVFTAFAVLVVGSVVRELRRPDRKS